MSLPGFRGGGLGRGLAEGEAPAVVVLSGLGPAHAGPGFARGSVASSLFTSLGGRGSAGGTGGVFPNQKGPQGTLSSWGPRASGVTLFTLTPAQPRPGTQRPQQPGPWRRKALSWPCARWTRLGVTEPHPPRLCFPCPGACHLQSIVSAASHRLSRTAVQPSPCWGRGHRPPCWDTQGLCQWLLSSAAPGCWCGP